MKHSTGKITCEVTKQVLIKLRRLKLYHFFFQLQIYDTRDHLKEEIRKFNYVDIKWHASEQPMDQRRDLKRIKNILKQTKTEIQHIKTYRI